MKKYLILSAFVLVLLGGFLTFGKETYALDCWSTECISQFSSPPTCGYSGTCLNPLKGSCYTCPADDANGYYACENVDSDSSSCSNGIQFCTTYSRDCVYHSNPVQIPVCHPTIPNQCSSGVPTSQVENACSYSWKCVGQPASNIVDCTANKSNSTSCNDSNSCTTGDVCTNGTCSGTNNPVQGTLSSWSSCSANAGVCTGTQTRTCTGNSCGGNCNGAALSQSCTMPPVQGTLTNWSTCTAACGGGTCTQTRSCVGASCGGNCNGAALTQTYTNNTPCGTCDDGNACTTDSGTYPNCTNTNNPVQGSLTGWSTCSAACGGGTCTQTRSCVGASCGGNCNGAALTQTYTNNTPCVSNPDLTAGAPSPTTATVNVAKTFSSTISNTGGASTGVSFSNFFQVSTAANGGGTITDLAASSMAALAAGGSNTASVSYTFTSASTYSIRACADKSSSVNTGTITESNEGNNCSGWTNVTVSAVGVNNSSCVSITAPATVTTGQTFSATVVMQNTGTKTWYPASVDPSNPHQLGSQNPQDNTTWGFSRAFLPVNSVAPGASATITINATAPATIGTYPFEWKMVQEMVEWFGATCAKTITVQVPPPPQPFVLYATPCCVGTTPDVWLVWDDSVGATGYDIYKNSSLFASNVTSGWGDTAITTGTTYSYYVKAKNSTGSVNSNTVNPTARDCSNPGPFTLTATPSCSGTSPKVTLEWTASGGAESYDVYRDGSSYLTGASSGYVDTVTSGVNYSYKVRALNSHGGYTDSNQQDVTGLSCVIPPTTYYNLNVIKSGQGTVTNSPSADASCGSNCFSYEEGTDVQLTAAPSAGRIFTGWTGCDTSTRDPHAGGTCNITMDGPKTVIANFAVDPNYSEF